MRDILVGGDAQKLGIADDAPRHEFDNIFDALQVNIGIAETLQSVSESVAALAEKKLPSLLPCSANVTAASEPNCLDSLFDSLGKRLFRRPVTPTERSSLSTVFKEARGRVSFVQSVGTVIEAMLQSPHFIYRTELGGEVDGDGRVRLTGYEVASALSYFLWRSTPDEPLLAAAAEGGLDSAVGIKAQAQRLLADPKAKDAFRDFVWQWFEINQLASGLQKSDPAFGPALATAMLEESRLFINDVAWSSQAGNGTLAALLTGTSTFADASVAELYGVDGPKGATFDKVQLDRTRRAGLLSSPAFLTAHSSPSGFSPIFPGVFVRKKLFCQTLPPPPPGTPGPSKDSSLTTRERFAVHRTSASCNGCHVSIDPIGFGFERYDMLGRFRLTETIEGKSIPLTGQGELINTDVDGAFAGTPELAAKLASSPAVKACFASHLLKFMLGRDTVAADARNGVDNDAINAVTMLPANSSFAAVMTALVATDAFVIRNAIT